jgi:hypothetical protein
VTLRARVIRSRYFTGRQSTDADAVFWVLRRLFEWISDSSASEKEVGNVLKELVTILTSALRLCRASSRCRAALLVVVSIRYGQDSEQCVNFILSSHLVDAAFKFVTFSRRRKLLLLDALIVRKS